MNKKLKKPKLNSYDMSLYNRIHKALSADCSEYWFRDYTDADWASLGVFKDEEMSGVGFLKNKSATKVQMVTPIFRADDSFMDERYMGTVEDELDCTTSDFDTALAEIMRRHFAKAEKTRKGAAK